MALDTAVADHFKWSLNYQIAKTDQNTLEDYFPFSRHVMRSRNTTYEKKRGYWMPRQTKLSILLTPITC